MINSAISKRYARALFEIAKERNIIDKVGQDLLIIGNALIEEEGFRKFVDSKIINKEEKTKFISNVFGESISEEVNALFDLIFQKNRESEIDGIIREYENIFYEDRGIALVDCYSAVNVSDEEKENLTQKLSEVLDKKIKISINIDENLLGGLKIKYKDQVIDGSIINKLDQYKKVLMK